MPYGQGEMKTNPTESEFFTTTEVGDITTGLVREATQNSLDEWVYRDSPEKLPVQIRIFHSGDKYALKPGEYRQYLQGLEDHLETDGNGIRNLPLLSQEPMRFLVFEDFNTNGLIGNPNESEDVEVGDRTKKHNFYHFWRNVGITGKPEDKLGRWGIGKTVFPVSSRINSFWGYTVQKTTSGRYLLGQSVLKSHNLKQDHKPFGFRPYGYYAKYEGESPFPFAVESEDILSNFTRSFHVSRTISQFGLSIVIPFVREEISELSLIKAAILQYYLPLIKGVLSFEICYEDHQTILNAENLKQVVDKYWSDDQNDAPSKGETLKFFDFMQWALGRGSAEFYSLKEQPVRNQPRWSDKLWEDIDVDELIEYFEKEGRVAFKVPVKFCRADDITKQRTCWFKVFFERDETLKTAETHFVRENITIIDIKSLTTPGIRALVLVEDKHLSNLLGDSENPAHTQWQKDSKNFVEKYVDGDKCIKFVINSITNLYQKLQKPAKGLEADILKNIFFIPIDEGEDQDNCIDDDSHKDDDDLGEITVPEIHAKRKMIRVRKIPGGVRILPHGIEPHNIPEIELTIAYDTTRGNPLKKYQKLDFELNKVPIKTIPKNCHFSFPQPNVIRFNPYSEDFELTVTGFDEKRDLFIKVETEYPADDKEI